MCSVRMTKSEGHLIRLKKLEQYYGNMYLTNYFKIRFKFYKYIIGNRHFSFQKIYYLNDNKIIESPESRR